MPSPLSKAARASVAIEYGRAQTPTGPRCGLTDEFSAPCWSVRRIPTSQ